MMQYTILVTLKTFHGIFKPTLQRFEFCFCADSRNEAIELASANVKSKGHPYDEKQVQVLDSLPISVAAEREMLAELSKLNRQTEETLVCVREAAKVVRELTRGLEAA